MKEFRQLVAVKERSPLSPWVSKRLVSFREAAGLDISGLA